MAAPNVDKPLPKLPQRPSLYHFLPCLSSSPSTISSLRVLSTPSIDSQRLAGGAPSAPPRLASLILSNQPPHPARRATPILHGLGIMNVLIDEKTGDQVYDIGHDFTSELMLLLSRIGLESEESLSLLGSEKKQHQSPVGWITLRDDDEGGERRRVMRSERSVSTNLGSLLVRFPDPPPLTPNTLAVPRPFENISASSSSWSFLPGDGDDQLPPPPPPALSRPERPRPTHLELPLPTPPTSPYLRGIDFHLPTPKPNPNPNSSSPATMGSFSFDSSHSTNSSDEPPSPRTPSPPSTSNPTATPQRAIMGFSKHKKSLSRKRADDLNPPPSPPPQPVKVEVEKSVRVDVIERSGGKVMGQDWTDKVAASVGLAKKTKRKGGSVGEEGGAGSKFDYTVVEIDDGVTFRWYGGKERWDLPDKVAEELVFDTCREDEEGEREEGRG